METEKFMCQVIAFEPIEIQTCLTPQNNCKYLRFVKDTHVVGKKMTRKDRKMAKCKGCLFYIEMEYRLSEKYSILAMSTKVFMK